MHTLCLPHPDAVDRGATTVLSIRGLRKDRGQGTEEAYTLSIPRLDILAGEKILITGPSGSGKSTLLDTLGMALRPDAADLFIFRPFQKTAALMAGDGSGDGGGNGRADPAQTCDVSRAWRENRTESLTAWRRHVGYVMQTGGLLPFLTVRENILSQRKLLGLPRDATDERLAGLLGITRLLHKFPAELSVGERQRAAIARALAASPPLVLADEPTAALDPANAAGVLELFCRAVDGLGSTLVLVTHAPEQVREMGFRSLHVCLQDPASGHDDGTLAVLDDSNARTGPSGQGVPGGPS